jgi:hypothetical protein
VRSLPLQTSEHAALSAVLNYWESHWDWECPTLFGLDLKEYRAAAETWRATADLAQPQVAFAMLGALREFLHGASALKGEAVVTITRMQKADLLTLKNRVGPFVLAVVEQQRTA